MERWTRHRRGIVTVGLGSGYTGIVRFWCARPRIAVSLRWPAMTRTPSSSLPAMFSGCRSFEKRDAVLAAGGKDAFARLAHLRRVRIARDFEIAESQAEITRPQFRKAEA